MSYVTVTRQIEVRVEPHYLADQSDPSAGRFFFAYRVDITNQSQASVQIRTRFWHITDGNGRVEVVEGHSVVGEEPILHPGESFGYTSGCPLETPHGVMVGHYGVEALDGTRFTIAIPAFSLDTPFAVRTLN